MPLIRNSYSGQGVLAEQLLQVPHCAQHECVTGKWVTQDHREVPVRDSHTQNDHSAANLCVYINSNKNNSVAYFSMLIGHTRALAPGLSSYCPRNPAALGLVWHQQTFP